MTKAEPREKTSNELYDLDAEGHDVAAFEDAMQLADTTVLPYIKSLSRIARPTDRTEWLLYAATMTCLLRDGAIKGIATREAAHDRVDLVFDVLDGIDRIIVEDID